MSRQLENYGINILQLHAEWLVANGYKQQATSCKRQIRMILINKKKKTSHKLQAWQHLRDIVGYVRKEIMTKKLKEEYQPGGSKRHVILDKAVQYLKDPRFGLQSTKHSFLVEEMGLSETEYLTCLNNATVEEW